MSKQKQIFLKVFSILASSRSTCTGLGKNNKPHVRFFVGMISYLGGLLVFNCAHAFIYLLDSPRHIACLRLPVSCMSGQRLASRASTWLGSSAVIPVSFQEKSE